MQPHHSELLLSLSLSSVCFLLPSLGFPYPGAGVWHSTHGRSGSLERGEYGAGCLLESAWCAPKKGGYKDRSGQRKQWGWHAVPARVHATSGSSRRAGLHSISQCGPACGLPLERGYSLRCSTSTVLIDWGLRGQLRAQGSVPAGILDVTCSICTACRCRSVSIHGGWELTGHDLVHEGAVLRNILPTPRCSG